MSSTAENITKVKSLLEKSQRIVIISHTNPDGDAIGSSLALYNMLSQMEFESVNVVIPDHFPDFLAWLPNSNQIVFHDTEEAKAQLLLQQADLIFCLDFNHVSRIAKLGDDLVKVKANKVLIDHHINPSNFFDVIISEVGVSSTAELLYETICSLDLQSLVNEGVASCFFVGIVTDTGSFSYAANNPRTHLITAELIGYGIDSQKIHSQIYSTYSVDRMKLLGYSISEGLTVLPEFHTSYIVLSKAVLDAHNYQVGDTEGLVNYALSIEGVVMCALFMERDDVVKISFRSKGDFSVNELAKKSFNGGGHKNAAGGRVKMNLGSAVTKFKDLVPSYQEDLVRVSIAESKYNENK